MICSSKCAARLCNSCCLADPHPSQVEVNGAVAVQSVCSIRAGTILHICTIVTIVL